MKLLCIDPSDYTYYITNFVYSSHDQRYYLEWSGWSPKDVPVITSLTLTVANSSYESYSDLRHRIGDKWLLIQIDDFGPFVNPTKPILEVAKDLYPEYFI